MQVVAHNLEAMNVERNLQTNANTKSKSSEKLASGYRINRAADDAAGLSISEKMRYQIRGLNRGTSNTLEGISLIQTAEGATAEMHACLQRMNELAVQAANDTNTQEEREALNNEANQLKSEIGRISRTTEFNDRTVLRAKQIVEIDVDDYADIEMVDKEYINTINAYRWGKTIDFSNVNENTKSKLIGMNFHVTCSENCGQQFSFNFTNDTSSKATVTGSAGRANLTLDIGINDSNIKTGKDVVDTIMNLVIANQGSLGGGGNEIKIGHANGIASDGAKLTMYASSKDPAHKPTYYPDMGRIFAGAMMAKEENIKFQVSYEPYREIEYIIKTINASTLGIDKLDFSTNKSAGKAITSINNAINNLSKYRSYMGAMQNRLEHVVASNENTEENTQAAESQLRDAKIDEEVTNVSKCKILEQAAHSLLAQSNQKKEGVLALLG